MNKSNHVTEAKLSTSIDHFCSVANNVVGEIGRLAEHERLRHDFRVRRGAFAAFEAHRRSPLTMLRRGDKVFYILFCVITVLAAPLIVLLAPASSRTVAWDITGIVSTVILLLWTYGKYTFTMAAKCLYEIVGFGAGIFTRLGEGSEDGKGVEEVGNARREPEDGRTVFWNMVLLILGGLISYLAIEQIFDLFNKVNGAGGGLLTTVQYHEAYLRFFGFVALLAFLFILMDVWVAATDRSHSESFIASSSAIYATVPMFIGILIMGMYMGLQYFEAREVYGLSVDKAIAGLSVEFVSGALSFQMIIANILFVFMKLNFLLHFSYRAVQTTKAD